MNESTTPGSPAGYLDITVDGKRVLVRDWAAQAVREALGAGSLYDWAASQPSPDLMRGRGVSYGVTLGAGPAGEGATRVVVRRNRHGGLLRFLTGELFLPPTRAPFELATAARLAAAGIATPEVIACAVYPAAGILARSDVMTRRLPPGGDLPELWRAADAASREGMLAAVAGLLADLARAGAWHADLNLKNIYIAATPASVQAYLLDVDRVTFPAGADVSGRNFARLARSARKWRERWGLDFDEAALARLGALALERS
jgi:hypothetical protein